MRAKHTRGTSPVSMPETDLNIAPRPNIRKKAACRRKYWDIFSGAELLLQVKPCQTIFAAPNSCRFCMKALLGIHRFYRTNSPKTCS